MGIPGKSRRLRKRRLRIALAVAAACVIVVSLALLVPRPPEAAPEVGGRTATLMTQADWNPARLDSAEAGAILDVLRQFGAVVTTGGSADVVDWDRFFAEIRLNTRPSSIPPAERERIRWEFRHGFEGSQIRSSADCQLRRLYLSDSADQAMAVTTRSNAEGHSERSRWWLIKREGRWRIYDWADLLSGRRMSHQQAGDVLAAIGRIPADVWAAHNMVLNAASHAIVAGDCDQAMALLMRSELERMPDTAAARHWWFFAWAQMLQGDYVEALLSAERAEQLNGDLPAVLVVRGTCLNHLGRFSEAEQSCRLYLDQVGDGGLGCTQLGDALAGQGKVDEAVAMYRRALDASPDFSAPLVRLVLLLPYDRKGEIAPCISRLSDPAGSLQALGDAMNRYRDYAGLAAVVGAFEPIVGDLPLRRYYIALLYDAAGDHDVAAGVLREIIPLIEDHASRQVCYAALADALVAAGRPLEAFEAYRGKEGFRYVAGLLATLKDVDGLAAVIEKYVEFADADPWLFYYRGELLVLRRDHVEAEKVFTRALALELNMEMRNAFRRARVYAMYKQGRWGDAYDRVGPRGTTFNQLASLMAADMDYQSLTRLVEAHTRSGEPADYDLWLAYLDLFAGRNEATVARLQAARQTILADSDLLTQATYAEMLVRALLRLDRIEKALAEARIRTQSTGDPRLEAIIYAATGDSRLTSRLLDRVFRPGYGAEAFFADVDVQSAMANPAVQALRDTYLPDQPATTPSPRTAPSPTESWAI